MSKFHTIFSHSLFLTFTRAPNSCTHSKCFIGNATNPVPNWVLPQPTSHPLYSTTVYTRAYDLCVSYIFCANRCCFHQYHQLTN
nr:MAG TPA: hypothetical protein [Caudoviricetes sp.]